MPSSVAISQMIWPPCVTLAIAWQRSATAPLYSVVFFKALGCTQSMLSCLEVSAQCNVDMHLAWAM